LIRIAEATLRHTINGSCRFEDYASARRVFWIVDNGSSHRGQASVERLDGEHPRLRLIHLPIHASWLNQVDRHVGVVSADHRRSIAGHRVQRGRAALGTRRAVVCRRRCWPAIG
jgi:hypothetical protein